MHSPLHRGLRLAFISAAVWCVLLAAAGAVAAPGTLSAFKDETELVDSLSRWQAEARRLRGPLLLRAPSAMAAQGNQAAPMAAPPPAPAAAAAPGSLSAAAESITNVQTAGVDEGGIVKLAGEHLLILRRGRLFSVRVGGQQLTPVAAVDAYAPGSNPQGSWYDELLVSGSTVVVVGYSYQRGGTEIGLFELSPDGQLAYRATYHLRSFDYYSARNYASRLVGRTLVFYSPTLLQPWGASPWQMLPGLRRWQPQASPADFRRILPATRIYRSDDEFDPAQPLALHTVTRCELGVAASGEMACESSAVLGPAGRVFYVSAGSVYVWTTGRPPRSPVPDNGERPQPAAEQPLSAVFRIPLDGTAPTGLKTAGVPVDQMSFLEDNSGHLNVLLREGGPGEGMWGSERTRGRMALLRLPLSSLGDGRGAAQRQHYRLLPGPDAGAVQNRFVGRWLLWGGPVRPPAQVPGAQVAPPTPGASNGSPMPPMPTRQALEGVAWALRFASEDEPQRLSPGHAIERIEALGSNAVLVGNAGADLHFSSVDLGGPRDAPVRLTGRHVQTGARQGETRSHGFFYRPTGPSEGLLGLPVLGPGMARRAGVFSGAQGSASVLFLRERQLGFEPLGDLKAQPDAARDDGCKASCVDWYGNARPIFLGERILALMGYELVEARLAEGRGGAAEHIVEGRRISFAPGVAAPGGRYSPFN